MTDAAAWLDLMVQASVLKTVPRTGWHLRGVPAPESVADHVFGTTFVAAVLAEMTPAPLDREKVLMLALLHDLPESLVGDIPRTGAVFLPPGAKAAAEASALTHLLGTLPLAGRWQELAREYAAATSPESRLVHDADRLEFLLQAWVYARSTGTDRLDDVRARYADLALATEAAERLRQEVLARW